MEETPDAPEPSETTDSTWMSQFEEYKSSERGSIVASDFDIDLNENPIESGGGRSSTMFSRDGSMDCKLEDFVIRKVIGKGAFGKVFLVENKNEPGQVFAMKSIRKDKIIELE